MSQITISNLMLYTMIALIGEIESNFRGVAVEFNSEKISIFFYLDGTITDEQNNSCTSIGAEIISHYEELGIEEKVIRLDYPIVLPEHKYWVYKRKEAPKTHI